MMRSYFHQTYALIIYVKSSGFISSQIRIFIHKFTDENTYQRTGVNEPSGNSAYDVSQILYESPTFTAWKVSKYGVISGPYFPVFGLNTEIYFVDLLIQSEYRKIRTRNNCVFGNFSRSVLLYVFDSPSNNFKQFPWPQWYLLRAYFSE